jgi:hypothetical protein
MCHRIALSVFAVIALCATGVQAQILISCPTKPGVYAKTNDSWTELPREADPVTTIKPNFLYPMLPKTNKEFAGERAFVNLHNPLQLCAVRVSANASFSLEKAVAKKGTRTIVRMGDFHSHKALQSQAVASLTDEQGNIHLMTTALQQGQYILVMLGTFTAMPKATSANPQADATAAMMESSAAMVQSIMNTNQGINFGLGID